MKDPRFVLPLCPECAWMIRATARGGPIAFCIACAPKASQILRVMLTGAPCYAIVRCPMCDLEASSITQDGDGVTWDCPRGCHP